MLKKLLVALITSAFALGAYAQAPKAETKAKAETKTEVKGEKKAKAKGKSDPKKAATKKDEKAK